MDLEAAIEVFAAGFCRVRSFTHPYLTVCVGPLIVMRDGPRKSDDTRSEEIIVHGLSPRDAVAAIEAYGPGRYKLSVVHGPEESEDDVRRLYKALRYRVMGSEPFFVHDLQTLPPLDSRVRRVETLAEADLVRTTQGKRQILPEHLGTDDAPVRLYAAWDGEEPVGWVSGIPVGDVSWVSNLYVLPDYRRRRLGRGLMAALLADDLRLGRRHSVLLASAAGSHLYPTLGYRQIGTLQLFAPPQGSAGLALLARGSNVL